MKQEWAKLSHHNAVAKAMDYMLKRNDAFTRFLADGRICLSNNAAERTLRGIALGRKAWLFAGSDRGGERAADRPARYYARRSATKGASRHDRTSQPINPDQLPRPCLDIRWLSDIVVEDLRPRGR